ISNILIEYLFKQVLTSSVHRSLFLHPNRQEGGFLIE
ncbi:unnamed protein product, partial [marine sediment metagenome]